MQVKFFDKFCFLYTTSHKYVSLFFAREVFPIAKNEFSRIKSEFTFGNWYKTNSPANNELINKF